MEGGPRGHLGPGRAAGGAHPARVPAADRRGADIFGIRGLTTPVNAAGLPALALPVPAAGGPRAANGPLPASVQLIGPGGSEDRLLAAGLVLEQAVR